MKQFGYEYLQGSNLLHKLTKPNGMTLTQSYETQRDLLTGMAYHRGSTLVAQREYTYDVLSRPTARTTSRQGNVVNDTFVHNSRSELASAQVNGETYGYDYDNVGNRRMSMEAGDYAFYEANALNQYTDITGSEDEADFSFTPVFDADGNQTLIKTETGIWTTVYNAENRPVSFTNEATGTVVTCAYDSLGRRSFKQVTVNGTVTLHQRYLYRGYLQIACIDLTRSHHPGLWLITWDPTEPIATRPLAIQKDGTWYTYGLDLTKNVCEIFGPAGYIATTYTYSPYGKVTATGSVTQPIQWSSEMWDSELDMVYYNWRHYNNQTGSWLGRDNEENNNLYGYIANTPSIFIDLLGMKIVERDEDWEKRKNLKVTGDFSLPIYDPNIKSINNMALTGFAKGKQYYNVANNAKIATKLGADGVYEAYVESIEEPIITVYKYWPPESFIRKGCVVSGITFYPEVMKYIMGHEQRRYTVIQNLNDAYIQKFPAQAMKMKVRSCDEQLAVYTLKENLQKYWSQVDKQIDRYYYSEQGKISDEMTKDKCGIDENNVYHIDEQPANISSPPPILEPAIIIEDLSIDEQADERGYRNRTAPPLRDFPPELQPKQ